MSTSDKLKIKLEFNGKKISCEEVGDNAHPTFKKILSIFSDKNDSVEFEEEDEITLG